MEKAQNDTSDDLMAQLIAAQLEQEANGEFFQVQPEIFSPNVPSCIDTSPWTAGEATSKLASPCSACGDVGENWVCLYTRRIFCSRYRNGCGVVHSRSSPSCVVHISTVDLSIWDHDIGAYLDVFNIPALRPAFAALHLAKHGTEAVFPNLTPVLDLGVGGEGAAAPTTTTITTTTTKTTTTMTTSIADSSEDEMDWGSKKPAAKR